MVEERKKELLSSVSAPFSCNFDIDYYDAVSLKLSELEDLLILSGAEQEIVDASKEFRFALISILEEYYKGNVFSAQAKMNEQIRIICSEDELAAVEVNRCSVVGDNKERIPFFRARLDADEEGFTSKEMGVIPFSQRTRCNAERFSIPGLPCLYAGNTSYVCWLEMGKPADYRFNVSILWVDNSIKLLDLTVVANCLFSHFVDGSLILSENLSIGRIKRIMLSICSSFRVKEKARIFKSEYIIPQLVMLSCRDYNLDGISYFTTKVSNSLLAGICTANIALFSKYENDLFYPDMDKSVLDGRVSVSDAVNYSVFKQMVFDACSVPDHLWIEGSRFINNIDVYGEQTEYRNTEFYRFDKYLLKRFKGVFIDSI